MNQTITPAAIRKTLTVQATPEKAFEVFTDGFDRWWPKSHYIGSSPLKTAILEPGVGGRWYGLHEDGSPEDHHGGAAGGPGAATGLRRRRRFPLTAPCGSGD